MTAASKRWFSRVVWSGLTMVAIGVPLLIWNALRNVEDCYAQWGAAEVVISFHDKHGRFPGDWSELELSFERGGAPHAIGLSFEQLREKAQIDFDRLHLLEETFEREDDIPEVITATSGRQVHYSGAEPNELVFQYFRRSRESSERITPFSRVPLGQE